jgi:hypothetical protein
MGIFDLFSGRGAVVVTPEAAEPNARAHIAVPDRPFINRPALDAVGLRRGQWVVCADGIGILTGARIDGLAEVTLQKPDGTTRMELDETDKAVPAVRVADMATLRAAHIEEIPDTRHEGADHLRGLGYISASEA